MNKLLMIMIISISTLHAGDYGKKEYKKCMGCHGVNGEKSAFNKTLPLNNQTKEELYKKMNGYRQGILSMYGMGNIKRKMTRGYTQEQLKELAAYIATLN